VAGTPPHEAALWTAPSDLLLSPPTAPARPGHAPATTPGGTLAAASRAPREPAGTPPGHKNGAAPTIGAGTNGPSPPPPPTASCRAPPDLPIPAADSPSPSPAAESSSSMCRRRRLVARGCVGKKRIGGDAFGRGRHRGSECVAPHDTFFVITANYGGNLGSEVVRRVDEAGKAGFFSCAGSFLL
jgi:hypothetical protein